MTNLSQHHRFRVIMADPPWSYRNGGNGAAKNHYPTMTPAALRRLPVEQLAADDAVLLLWATWPQLDVAMSVIAAWGFAYVTGFPWVKLYDPPFVDEAGELVARPVYGTGAWVRGCSEMVLIGRRGKARPPEGNWLGLLSQRLRHSRKPEHIYDYAESFPGPWLELFARQPARPGWAVWGNEVESTITLEATST